MNPLLWFYLLLVILLAEAKIDCKNGFVYPDSPDECECNQCWSGPSCTSFDSECVVDAGGGDPRFFQEYWEEQGPELSVTLAADYRTHYYLDSNMITAESRGLQGKLRDAIFQLHKFVGNVNPAGYTIVTGYGCTQLISASMYAMYQMNKDTHAEMTVYAKPPYYNTYDHAAMVQKGLSFSTSLDLDPTQVIEFNTWPNNPDAMQRENTYPTSNNSIHDMVYFWPSFTEVNNTQATFPVMLFTLSKLTGHAGTRFGWAMVRDPVVAQHMQDYMSTTVIAVSVDAQYRALRMIKSLSEQDGAFFKYVKTELEHRWDFLEDWFSQRPERFTVHNRRDWFYAWVHCEAAPDCARVFQDAGIMGVGGSVYGVDGSYMRLELVMHSQVWEIMAQKLAQM